MRQLRKKTFDVKLSMRRQNAREEAIEYYLKEQVDHAHEDIAKNRIKIDESFARRRRRTVDDFTCHVSFTSR
jgi:oligoribonuclease (3'-5' exoribonuclease)